MMWFTAFVLFLMYLNAPAVAVHKHGAPFLVAAIVPMLLAIPVAQRVFQREEALIFPRVLAASILMLVLHGISALASSRPYESIDTGEGFQAKRLIE